MRNAKTEVDHLSQWYETKARPLPWRESHDPYRIWISEVMLQQTQVTTVIPYYLKFLTLFPTVEALAGAAEATVLSAWSGLGYYSRARNLHKGAKFVVETYGGIFPKTREEILEVPGIGPYTAGAVLSIAFDLPVPLVDGNVQRVFARFFGVEKPLASSEAQKLFWTKADEWVKHAVSPRVLNQALMELGATVCIKGKPRCEQCPVQGGCVAFANGWQERLPLKKVQRDKVDLWWMGLVLEAEGKLFLKQNPQGEWWADLWDFPKFNVKGPGVVSKEMPSVLETLPPVAHWEELDHQKHTVTHHRIHVAPVVFHLKRRLAPRGVEGRWFTPEELSKTPVSSLVRKVMGAWAGAKLRSA